MSHLWHMEVPGQGSNQSCSCWPVPQPQHCQMWAALWPVSAAHSSAGYLIHWARPGIEPTTSQILVLFLTCWATMGMPLIFNLLVVFRHLLFLIAELRSCGCVPAGCGCATWPMQLWGLGLQFRCSALGRQAWLFFLVCWLLKNTKYPSLSCSFYFFLIFIFLILPCFCLHFFGIPLIVPLLLTFNAILVWIS